MATSERPDLSSIPAQTPGLAGVLWHLGGWNAFTTGGVVVLSLALLLWFLNRQTLAHAGRGASRRHLTVCTASRLHRRCPGCRSVGRATLRETGLGQWVGPLRNALAAPDVRGTTKRHSPAARWMKKRPTPQETS